LNRLDFVLVEPSLASTVLVSMPPTKAKTVTKN
jgi:hypothetical protein